MSAILHYALNALKKQTNGQFDLNIFCFKEQLAFIQDPSRFKTAVCSRRSGKTIACAADLIDTAIRVRNIVCLYITLSRVNAKRIIWPELLKLNRLFSLGGKANETDLSLKFPNGSVIYVSGAKDKSEIENFRGLPLKKVYIDECQSFRSYIQELVDDVISKALFDYSGSLCLIGTPALVPSGYFYDCSHSQNWSQHGWTMFNNPHLAKKSGKTPQALIQEDCERMGVTLEHPKIQRECFGRWIVDSDSLVFHYSESNHFTQSPRLDTYVIGVDLGFDDADAIAVIGWNQNDKEAYLVKEIVKSKQGITELAGQIEALIKEFNPIKIVMDTGGLGKKIAEELAQRYNLPIDAAEKSRKFEFIELLNDALRTRRFYAKKESSFAQDCGLVEWDRDLLRNPDKLRISDGYHSDICDAVLYAFREALHWLSEMPVVAAHYSSPAWQKQQEKEMEEMAEAALRNQKDEDFWKDPWEGLSGGV
jgi:hypothetical protein